MTPAPNEPPDPQALSAATGQALARGIALFNGQQFWEAHEAWEDAWMEEEGPTRQFLQGLIQVAAGFFKARVQRQPNGCVKLLRSGAAKLRPLGAVWGGVDLARLMTAVDAALARALEWQAGTRPELPPEVFPRIEPSTSGPDSAAPGASPASRRD